MRTCGIDLVDMQQGDVMSLNLGIQPNDDADVPVTGLLWMKFTIGNSRMPFRMALKVVTTEESEQAVAVVQEWKKKFLPQQEKQS